MRVVVSGGTGFLGSAVVAELRRRGHDVAAASRSGEVRIDVNDAASLRAAFAGADAVVNAVQFAGYPVENPRRGRTFEQVDAIGTERQVAAAVDAGVRRFAYLSGVGADPHAARHWHRAKARAEAAVHGSGMAGFVLRPSWVFGPHDPSLNRFARIARWSPFLPVVGDGRQALEPVFVDDLAWAVGEAIDRGVEGTFEIGGPERLTMDEVLRTMLAAMGRRRPLVHVPTAMMKLAGRVLSHLPGPPLSADAVEFLVCDAVADTASLAAALPGLPRTALADGLATYLGR